MNTIECAVPVTMLQASGGVIDGPEDVRTWAEYRMPRTFEGPVVPIQDASNLLLRVLVAVDSHMRSLPIPGIKPGMTELETENFRAGIDPSWILGIYRTELARIHKESLEPQNTVMVHRAERIDFEKKNVFDNPTLRSPDTDAGPGIDGVDPDGLVIIAGPQGEHIKVPRDDLDIRLTVLDDPGSFISGFECRRKGSPEIVKNSVHVHAKPNNAVRAVAAAGGIA